MLVYSYVYLTDMMCCFIPVIFIPHYSCNTADVEKGLKFGRQLQPFGWGGVGGGLGEYLKDLSTDF